MNQNRPIWIRWETYASSRWASCKKTSRKSPSKETYMNQKRPTSINKNEHVKRALQKNPYRSNEPFKKDLNCFKEPFKRDLCWSNKPFENKTPILMQTAFQKRPMIIQRTVKWDYVNHNRHSARQEVRKALQKKLKWIKRDLHSCKHPSNETMLIMLGILLDNKSKKPYKRDV